MKDESSGATRSHWLDTAEQARHGALASDERADVCVVGAGLGGLSAAYLLAREGRSVVVVEDGEIGSGETGRTTAHLSNALDDRYSELERLFGQDGARLAGRSHTAAIDRVEQIAREEGIACHFGRVSGYLFSPPGKDRGELERECEAAKRAGLADVHMVASAPVGAFDTGPALHFPRQGEFHPMLYLAGIARAVERMGGRIYTRTRAREVVGGSDAHVVTEAGPVVRCGAAVVATNTPFNSRVLMHTKQAPYRTYVLGVSLPRGVFPRILLWDTLDPYHYLRLGYTPASLGDRDVLLVGGEDHKTGQEHDPAERFARLEAWTRERFPSAGEVVHAWSGQVMEPLDGLAFLGRSPLDEDNVYVITGDSGHGMTHCTLGGMIVADLIQGRTNLWAELYDPGRFAYHAVGEAVRETANMAAQYLHWLSGGDVSSLDAIAAGSGAVVNRGIRKVAVYRDPAGALHCRSAVCTHLGCAVGWNDLEKTWDCPCHGSRFDPYGRVISAPAITDLAPAGAGVEAEAADDAERPGTNARP